MSMGIVATVAGIGTSIYGASRQAKAQREANAMSKQIADETNAYNYRMWLESQGIGPDGKPINVGLPRWAMVQRGTPATKRRLVPKGTAQRPATTRRLVARGSTAAPGVTPAGSIDSYGGQMYS